MNTSKLKKTITLMLIFLGLASLSIAQLSGGGHIGTNIANLRGSSITNNSPIVGLNIGGFLNYKLDEMFYGKIAERLSIQGELNIETKGTKSDYTFYNTTDTNSKTRSEPKSIKQAFTYVVIPLVIKYTTEEKNSFSFSGEAGAYLGGLFGLKFDGEISRDNNLGDDYKEQRKYRDDYSGFDFGILAGVGVNYRLPFGGRKQPFTGFAHVRYNLGLYNIGQIKEKTNDIPDFMLDDVKTEALAIRIGLAYQIPIEKKR